MSEVSAAVDVAVPADRLWAAVTDWAGQGRWIPLTSVTVSSGGGGAVGDRVVARTALGPLGFADPMEITVWDAPRRCVVRHLGRVVRGEGEFAVESLAARRSRFVWTERLDAPFGRLGAAAVRLSAPLSRAALRLALRRLARQVGG